MTFPNIWLVSRDMILRFLQASGTAPAPSGSSSPTIDPTDEFATRRGQHLAIDEDRIRRDYHASLLQFIHTVRYWGSEPVLMTQVLRTDADALKELESLKHDYGIEADWCIALHRTLNEAVRAVVKENGVVLVDLARNVPPVLENLYDVVHFSETGSQLAAQLIADQLADILKSRIARKVGA